MTTRKTRGLVALVGAGPGDPGLLTLRSQELLGRADVVLADAGVPLSVLALAAGELLHVGDEVTTDEATALAVERARAGQTVVRVLAGDGFSSGAGAAAAEALAKARVQWEAVPGVPVTTAVPIYAGMFGSDEVREFPANGAAAAARSLLDEGLDPATPAAFVRWGTTGRQRTEVSDLGTLARAGKGAAGVLVAGAGVLRRERFDWFESRPLAGLTVLVPRTRTQAGELSDRLRALGAEPLEVPTIEVEPPRNPASLDRAVTGLVSGRYAWVAFTSANAVAAIRTRLEALGLDARVLSGVKIAAVGAATSAALADFGLRPDLVPESGSGSDALVAAWPQYDQQLDYLDRVLAPRADLATDTLIGGLKAKGWLVDDVTAYRTVRAAAPSPEIRAQLRDGGVDAIVFTSSSTARNLVGIAGRPAESTLIAAIGPQTAHACAELGLRVDVEADSTSVEAVVEALARFVENQHAPAPPARAGRRGAPAPRKTAEARGRTSKVGK